MDRIFRAIVGLSPVSIREKLELTLNYAGLRISAVEWMAWALVFSTTSALICISAASLLRQDAAVTSIAGLLGFSAIAFIQYLSLYFRVEDRKQRVEKVLPDFLNLVAANIKAGMSPIVALRSAARPEFGPLEEEVKVATAKSLGIESFEGVLLSMTKNINSNAFKRTVELFVSSLKGGGNIAAILENAAADLRQTQELQAQLITGTQLYVMFIVFITTVGMPALMAVSMRFIQTVQTLQPKATSSLAAQIGLGISTPIDQNFLWVLSIVFLTLTCFFTSMLIGVIHEGRKLYGIKWAPALVAGGLISFYVLNTYVLKMVLG